MLPDGLVLHVVLATLDHLLDGGTHVLAVHHPQPVALAQADGAEFWGAIQYCCEILFNLRGLTSMTSAKISDIWTPPLVTYMISDHATLSYHPLLRGCHVWNPP